MSPVAAEQITRARSRVADLERRVEQARARSAAATPGNGDPGALSGVRRRPNRRADARRFAAYDREAALCRELAQALADLAWMERRAAAETAEEASRGTVDLAALAPGGAVRTRHGWHRVIRVNAKSITVETGHSWTDRIPLAKVLEVRP